MNSPLLLAGVVIIILVWIISRARRSSERPHPSQWESPPRVLESARPELPSEAEHEFRSLLVRKNKIAAIKLVREHTGWGLKQAKQYVEWWMDPRRPFPDVPPPGPPPVSVAPVDMDAEVRGLVAAGHLVDAVKRVRERTGWSLQKSTEYVKGLDRSERSP